MDRVGKALLQAAAYKWMKLDEWVHFLMDNAGGHWTDEVWEAFTKDLDVNFQGVDHLSVSSIS